MICEKCEHIVCLSAFSYDKCIECGIGVTTPHIPCYKLCPECSAKLNKCEQCGGDVK